MLLEPPGVNPTFVRMERREGLSWKGITLTPSLLFLLFLLVLN